jgi:uncharacterized membrane protein YfcA
VHASVVQFALFFLLGGAIGFFGGLFGVGGAIVSIPVLAVAFGMSEQQAQGTSLLMVVSNVVVALWRYNREQKIDWRMGAYLATVAIPFSYLGAHLATELPERIVRYAFASFVIAIAAFMAWRTGRALAPRAEPLPFVFVGVVGAISGFMAGAFGIGGAMFTIPAMSVFFGLSQVAAQGQALVLAVPGALVGLVTYTVARDVAWLVGIALALGGCTTVVWGAHVAHRLPDRTLRWLWICFLLVAATALILRKSS